MPIIKFHEIPQKDLQYNPDKSLNNRSLISLVFFKTSNWFKTICYDWDIRLVVFFTKLRLPKSYMLLYWHTVKPENTGLPYFEFPLLQHMFHGPMSFIAVFSRIYRIPAFIEHFSWCLEIRYICGFYCILKSKYLLFTDPSKL